MTNKRAISLLFLANSISGCAQGISMIGVVWYINSVLKVGSIYGVFYAFVVLCSMFWGLFAGTLIDRYNRKNIFLGINLVGGIVLLSAAGIGFSLDKVPFALSAMVFAATTFVYNIHYPTLYAIAQEISEPKDYVRITSYIEIQGQATTVLSGAMAALLMQGYQTGDATFLQDFIPTWFHFAPWKLPSILLLDGITYLVSLAVIWFVQYTPIKSRVIDHSSIKERMMYGIDYLRNNRLVLVFGTASLAVFITIIICSYYQMPVYIDKFLHRQSAVFAGSELFFAFGALFAGIFARYLFKKINIVPKVIALSILAALCYFVFIFNKNLAVFFCCNFLLGLSNAAIRIYRVTYLFNLVPNHVIGRVNGILNLTSYFFRFLIGLFFAIPYFNLEEGVIYCMLFLALFCLLGTVIILSRYKILVAEEHKKQHHATT